MTTITNTRKVVILTESELLNYRANAWLAKIFAGGKDELKQAREQGFIVDLFSCDPDYIRVPELSERIPFIEYKKGTIHYVIINDDNERGNTYKMLEAFFMPSYKEHFNNKENQWNHFDSVSNGIAFRGGAGYAYTIWDYIG